MAKASVYGFCDALFGLTFRALCSPIHDACEAGDLGLLERLLASGQALQEENVKLPAHKTRRGNEGCYEAKLRHLQADHNFEIKLALEQRDQNACAPLHVAVLAGLSACWGICLLSKLDYIA